ncbi:MAG: bifunctional metallophosphatase/5'-nucleotidase [Paludibacteraceae bacterium]|nr:bifunctional metallophosphatase/5'-nucleotidase [Paludibacteraceae bacterium]
MKKFLTIVLLAALLVGCSEKKDVVILFDNDVHCAVDLYSKMASVRDSLLQQTPYVLVTSAGDFVQGDVIGSISQGEYIVDIMNAVPYDIVTIGNHEFDYGIEQQLVLTDRLEADEVCCNFTHTDGSPVYPSYQIKRFGKTKVAFIGVATPTTYTSSTPAYFQDSTGHVIYDFHAGNTFALLQQAADEVRRKGADYVVALSHLGDDTAIDCSPDMVRATTGIDAVLDGHAHHYIQWLIPNADGDSIPLLSTGARGERIGCLTLSESKGITYSFIEASNISRNARVDRVIEEKDKKVQETVNKVVGYGEVALNDNDADGNRLVRLGETNLSDFVSDAMRWATGADIGVIHGGSLRASLPEGDITMGDMITLLPFNNHLAKVRMTGQELLDAFEVAVSRYPLENGDFHIASGMRYCIDPAIATSVEWDDNRMFLSVGKTRRIVSMEVEDAVTHRWTAIDPNATYTVGGLDYTLLHQGSSWMFRYATPMECEKMKDTDVLFRYLHSLGDTIRAADYPTKIIQPRFRTRE